MCTAGIEDKCVLSAIVTYVDVIDPGPKLRRNLDFSVSGLNCKTDQHLLWARSELKPGDKIEIAVVDTPLTDPPKTVKKPMIPEDIAKDELSRIHARRKTLLKELKDSNRNERGWLRQLNTLKKQHQVSSKQRKKKT